MAVSVVSGRLTDMISLLSDSHTTLTLSNDRPPVCVNSHDINSESEDNTLSVEELNTGSTYIYIGIKIMHHQFHSLLHNYT